MYYTFPKPTKVGRPTMDPNRIWGQVRKSPDCWEWLGKKDAKGYGFFHMGGEQWRAHRAAFVISGGCLLPGQILLHSCDNPSCVNPGHMMPGTIRENNQDRARKGRSKPIRKLSVEDVREILVRVRDEPKKALARRFNVSPSLIRQIAHRTIWRWIKLDTP